MLLDAVQLAVDVTADAFGVTATYTPLVGAPATVRAIRLRQDPQFADVATPGWVIHLPLADVPVKPADGATILIGTTTFRVRAVREAAIGLLWVCDVDEVVP